MSFPFLQQLIRFLSSNAASSISKNPKHLFVLLGNPKPNQLPNKNFTHDTAFNMHIFNSKS